MFKVLRIGFLNLNSYLQPKLLFVTFKELLNFALRSINPFAKFVFLTFLGKVYGSSFLGEFSLFSTTINISLYFVGFDFYNFCIREFVKNEDLNNRNKILTNQFIFYLFSYVFFFTLTPFLFRLNFIPLKFIYFFLGIVLFDHLSQELFRIFNADKKPLIASVLLLMRNALWAVVLIGLIGFNVKIDLWIIFLFWFIFSACSVILGFQQLFKKYKFRKSLIDFSLIKRGLSITVIFFTTTMSSKALEFSNRYIIDYYMSKSDLGVFSFFTSISNQLIMIVDSVVIVTMMPILIKLISDNRESGMIYYRKFFRKTIIVAFIGAICLGLISYPLLHFIQRPEFLNEFYILIIVLVGQVLYVMSFVPHYLLFALHRDIGIFKATVFAAILGILFNILLIKLWGLTGAAIGFVFSGLSLFIFRTYFLKSIINGGK